MDMTRTLGGMVLAAAAVLATAAPMVQAGVIAGPDGFGHVAVDAQFNLRDISTTGTQLALGDDSTASVGLGFDFDYFGSSFDTVFVSSNGFLSFSSSDSACCAGLPLPADGTANMIAAA